MISKHKINGNKQEENIKQIIQVHSQALCM